MLSGSAWATPGAPIVRLLIDDSYPLDRAIAADTYAAESWETETLFVYLVVDSIQGGYVSGMDLELRMDADTALVTIGATVLHDSFVALPDTSPYLGQYPEGPGIQANTAVCHWPIVVRQGPSITAVFEIESRSGSLFSHPIVLDRYSNPRTPRASYSAAINTPPENPTIYADAAFFVPRDEHGAPLPASGSMVVPGQIFVEVAPGLIPESATPGEAIAVTSLQDSNLVATLAAAGCSELRRIFRTVPDSLGLNRRGDPLTVVDATRCLLGTITSGIDPDSLAAELAILPSITQSSSVPTAEPPGVFPNDPRFSFQSNLYRIGAPEAWERVYEDLRFPMLLPVIDTGINPSSDFCSFTAPRVRAGWNYTDNNGNYDDGDVPCGRHGTRAAGVMAASTNNDNQVAGMAGGWDSLPAYECTGPYLASLKVYPNNAFPSDCYLDAAADAAALYDATFAYDNYAISCNGIIFDYFYPVWLGAYQSYVNAGVVCAAKHNGGTTNGDIGESIYSYPGDILDAWEISVGASSDDADDHREEFSNYGGNIDLVAPHFARTVENLTFTGTSSATPLTAGAVAVLLMKEPWLYVEDCENLLEAGCRDVVVDPAGGGNLVGPDQYTGAGRLDIGKSLGIIDAAYAPYELAYGEAGGGSSIGLEGIWPQLMAPTGDLYNCDNEELEGGYYVVNRHDVRVNVSFDDPWGGEGGVPRVWGIGDRSTGWSGANPNFRHGWSKVVPGTVTTTGCQMQTYVYAVYDVDSCLGWWPCSPANVNVGYGILGIRNPTAVDGGGREADATRDVAVHDLGGDGIEFRLRGAIGDDVSCAVFDVSGREVASIGSGRLRSVVQSMVWDWRTNQGTSAGQGIYVFKATIGPYIRTGKVVVIER
jgi:Subtilase family